MAKLIIGLSVWSALVVGVLAMMFTPMSGLVHQGPVTLAGVGLLAGGLIRYVGRSSATPPG